MVRSPTAGGRVERTHITIENEIGRIGKGVGDGGTNVESAGDMFRAYPVSTTPMP